MYCDTGLTMSMPSLSSLPWIREAPRKRIFAAHLTDQLSHILRDCRSAMPAVMNLPSPKQS